MKRKTDSTTDELLPDEKKRKVQQKIVIPKDWIPYSGPGIYVKGNNSKLPLQKSEQFLSVHDFLGRIRMKQFFFHAGSSSVECVYKFPIQSETSVPISVTAELYNRVTKERTFLKSQIKKKEEAQERYDDAIAESGTAMLVEKEQDSVVALNLGNLQPQTEVTLEYTFIVELDMEIDKGNVEVKAFVQGWKGEGQSDVYFDASVSVGKVVDVKCLSHGQFVIGKRDERNVQAIAKDVGCEKDFIVLVKVVDVPTAFWVVEKKLNDVYAHMLSILPNVDDSKSGLTELIIIVDRSGSMSGSRMKYAKEAMQLFLKSLDPDQKVLFNVVSFGSTHKKMFPESVLFSEESCKKALDEIGKFSANFGGTDILSPIQDVLKCALPNGYTRAAFLLTDGEDGNVHKIIQCVRENSQSTRFFTFGIGSGIQPMLLDGVAQASNGQSCFFDKSDEIQENVMKQLNRALQPCFTNFNVVWPNGYQVTSVGNETSVLFNHTRSCFYFLSNSLPNPPQVKIEYTINSGTESHVLTPVQVFDSSNSVGIGEMTAMKRILHLKKTKKENQDEITKLALLYSIMTKYTSFIMTKQLANTQRGEMVEIDQTSKVKFEVRDPPRPKNRMKKKRKRMAMSLGKQRGVYGSRGGRGGGFLGGSFGNRGIQSKNFSLSSKDVAGDEIICPGNPLPPPAQADFFDLGFDEEEDDDVYDNAPQMEMQKERSSFFSFSKQDFRKEKLEQEQKPKPKVNISNLLMAANLKGIWTMDILNELTNTLGLKGLTHQEIEKHQPQGASPEQWITAIVVVALQKKFSGHKNQWNLIVKKSLKSVGSPLLKDAEKFLSKWV